MRAVYMKEVRAIAVLGSTVIMKPEGKSARAKAKLELLGSKNLVWNELTVFGIGNDKDLLLF